MDMIGIFIRVDNISRFDKGLLLFKQCSYKAVLRKIRVFQVLYDVQIALLLYNKMPDCDPKVNKKNLI